MPSTEHEMTPELNEQTEYGNLFTISEFIVDCDDQNLIDSDGFGYLATADKESEVEIIPSNRRKTVALNPWATHVMWFNR